MRTRHVILVVFILVLPLIGCSSGEEVNQVEVTREVPVTVLVTSEVEVTREVPVTVEVLKEIEVTREVQVTIPSVEEEAEESPEPEELPEVSIPDTEVMVFSSSVTGRDYRIYIGLPEGYTVETAYPRKYPVLYLLDGYYWFAAATEITRMLTIGEEIDKLIVVGIGYPTDDLDRIEYLRPQDLLPSSAGGGSADFLAFIREELTPYLEQNYRIMPGSSILAGHSFGGLFVLDVLFRAPEAFDAYLAMSPGLWFGNRAAFDIEATYVEERNDLPVKLFLSVGELEPETFENMEFNMAPNLIEFHQTMKDRDYEGLEMELVILEQVGHAGSFPGALARGLLTIRQ
jgi:predicted alpha/beta superfamily hydrolase